MSQTATITPTVPVHERWEATTPVTGDYARDCAELAREALSHVGFTRFEETPFEDVLACCEGDLPVTVAVLPVPVEGFEMTLDDLQSLIDEDVVAHGAALCVGRALASDGPLPERLQPRRRACARPPRARGVAVVAMTAHSTTRERSPPGDYPLYCCHSQYCEEGKA